MVLKSPDFSICEVTGGIGRPKITGRGFGPDPKISSADIQPAARTAATLHVLLFFFEFGHQWLTLIRPYFTERAVPDIAERIMAPELIGMD